MVTIVCVLDHSLVWLGSASRPKSSQLLSVLSLVRRILMTVCSPREMLGRTCLVGNRIAAAGELTRRVGHHVNCRFQLIVDSLRE